MSGNATAEIVRLMDEIERLQRGLKMIVAHEYDRGYAAETFAEAVLTGHEPQCLLASGRAITDDENA